RSEEARREARGRSVDGAQPRALAATSRHRCAKAGWRRAPQVGIAATPARGRAARSPTSVRRGAHVASRRAVRVIALSCVLVLAPASPGAAQTEADADDLLREGVAFAEAGEHARAVAWFERARAIA